MSSKTSAPASRWPERPAAAAAAPDPRPLAAAGTSAPDEALPARLLLAVAPLHKRALGIAVGTVCGLIVALVTVFHVLVRPSPAPDPALLKEYFYGYEVSWVGALVGAWWGFFVGFVGGWFLAFTRNFAIAVSLFITRTRAQLEETRDFLDHI